MTEKYVQTLNRSLDVLEVLAQAEVALGVPVYLVFYSSVATGKTSLWKFFGRVLRIL